MSPDRAGSPRQKPQGRGVKAALYVRVSKEEKVTKSVSLDAQEERLRAHCTAEDWSVIAVYRDDGQSAGSLDRTALQRLLADAETRKFEVLCVFKLDRLTRSVKDLGQLLEDFEKWHVALVSLSEHLNAATAAGRLIMNVLGSVAQWEREAIGERTSVALRYRRENRRVYGEIPYGFESVGTKPGEKQLRPIDRELAVVRRVYALRSDGLTMRAIAAALNADRIRTKKGRKWAPAQIHYMLKNDLYKPYLVQA